MLENCISLVIPQLQIIAQSATIDKQSPNIKVIQELLRILRYLLYSHKESIGILQKRCGSLREIYKASRDRYEMLLALPTTEDDVSESRLRQQLSDDFYSLLRQLEHDLEEHFVPLPIHEEALEWRLNQLQGWERSVERMIMTDSGV
ncbi:hypothetical protein ACHAQJ_000479 [Trichoderma viride]